MIRYDRNKDQTLVRIVIVGLKPFKLEQPSHINKIQPNSKKFYK